MPERTLPRKRESIWICKNFWNNTHTPRILLALLFVLGIAYFYPVFSSLSSSIKFQSITVIDTSAAVATTNIPLLVYSILHILYFDRELDKLIRFAVVFAAFASFLAQYLSQFTLFTETLFVCINYWQVWVWTCVSFMSLSRYDTSDAKVFRASTMAVISLAYSLGRFVDLYTLFSSNQSLRLVSVTLLYASTIGLVFLFILWGRHLFRKWKAASKMAPGTNVGISFLTENEWTLTLLIMSIIFVASSFAVLAAKFGYYSTSFFMACQILAIFYSSCLYTYFNFIDQMHTSNLSDALETKKTFVRYVSHEIRFDGTFVFVCPHNFYRRTPLNIVVVGLQLLEDQVKEDINSPEIPITIAEMRESCSTAVEILNGLLDYEKLDSGLMECEKSEVSDASGFLLAAMRPFHLSASAKELEFILESNVEGEVRILIDENKVSRNEFQLSLLTND